MADLVTRTDSAPADGRAAAEIAQAMVRNDALINRDLIRQWLLWGFFWVMFAPTVGVVISTKFNYPDFFEIKIGRAHV